MLKNYILVALRNLEKHKGYSFINIAGFAVGIACCIMLGLYINAELSYDRYHVNAERIFRLGVRGYQGETQYEWGDSNAVAALALRTDYPEVINTVRFGTVPDSSVRYGDKLFYEGDFLYAENSVFDVFSWRLIKGDPSSALKSPSTVVISQDVAEKYFGSEEPMGKILIFNNQDSFTVTGVIQNVPENSTLTFDALCSFETLYSQGRGISPILRNWLDFNFETYLLLEKGFDYRRLEAKLPALLEKHAGRLMKIRGSHEEFFLQPLRDIHLRRPGDNAVLYVYVFSIIALFVLLIACFNFMNLSTARSAERAREVGLRKVLGAHRTKLIFQFLGESILYSFFAFLFALVLVEAGRPLLQSLLGYDIPLGLREMIGFLPVLMALILATGLVAGSYPALFLSSFQPVWVVRGQTAGGTAGRRLRRMLVVVQFAISIALIIGTGLIRNQLNYLENKSLGFNKDNIVVLPLVSDEVRKSIDVIKDALLENPQIVSLSSSSALPGRYQPLNSKFPEGYAQNEFQLMTDINVDQDFLPTLGIEVIEGRNFSEEFPGDKAQSVIINEAAAGQFGWEDPIGKIIRGSDSRGLGMSTKKVIGMVEDFHLEPLSQRIRPLFIAWEPEHRFMPLLYLLVKMKSQNVPETLAFIERTWRAVFPGIALDSYFLDESFGRQLAGIESARNLFTSFSFLAMLIACLGLFGMSAYTAEQRTREIGIRKVLGCSLPGLVFLLSREVMTHIIVAAAISWPLIYILMNRWLQSFPYRINLSLLTFLSTFLLVFVIGVITVSFQAVRAALADPVKSLRYE